MTVGQFRPGNTAHPFGSGSYFLIDSFSNVVPQPSVRVAKRSIGGVGTFVFDTAQVTNQGDTITTVTSGVTVTSPTVHVGTVGTAMAVNETGGATGYSISVTCTDANSATTGNAPITVNNNPVVIIPAANMRAGAAWTCLYTNTSTAPVLNTVKTLTGINGAVPGPGATLKSGDIADYTITVTNTGASAGSTLVREIVPTNMVFTAAGSTAGWTCANGAAAGTVCDQTTVNVAANSSTSVVFRTTVVTPLAAGTTQITNGVQVSVGTCSSCSVTTAVTNMNAVKQLQGINGVAATAGAAVKPGDVLDYVITVTNTGGAAGGTQLNETVPAGTTFSNAAPSTGWSCADGSPAGTACNQVVVAAAGGSATANFRVVVNANTTGLTQIGNTVTSTVGSCSGCVVTDPLLPTLRLAKTSLNGTGSFNFTLGGVSTGSETLATVTAGTPVTSAILHAGTAGTAASVTESPAFGFSTATSCTDTNGAASGNGAGAITTANGTASVSGAQMRAGAAWLCTYTNTRLITNLSVVKTANPTNVQTGGTVVFTLTINNAGPAAANGSILRDKPGAGLSCTAAPTCTASGGASCPSAAALTAPALTSNAGVAIPVLPAGGQAVVTLTCVATASGQ